MLGARVVVLAPSSIQATSRNLPDKEMTGANLYVMELIP